MKKTLLLITALVLIGLFAVPVWAGGPGDTAREWVERSLDSRGLAPEAVPEAGYLYYIDLMSTGIDVNGQWVSFLVVSNWSLNTRIHVFTDFIPTNGTPNDIESRDFYINPNDVVYLTANNLGFNNFPNTNWFGVIFSDTNIFYSAGVLLFHSEYGLTWIKGDGPWQI